MRDEEGGRPDDPVSGPPVGGESAGGGVPRDVPPAEPRLRDLLRGNVGALSGTSFLNDAASEMAYPLLPLFLVGVLGAGPAFLGVVEGVADSTASLTKLAGGFLSDRLRRRKPLVAWGYGLAAVVRPLLAVVTAPWHVLFVRFVDRAGKGIRSAPRDVLLVESVPRNRAGTAFGLHRAADHAGSVLGPLLASLVLLLLPGRLRIVFALTAIPGLLALLLVWRGVREVAPSEPQPSPDPGAEPEGSPPPVSLRELGPAFPRYLGVLALFSLGNASDAFLLLRAQDLGVTAALLPLLWGAFHVSKMVWNVPGGILADRYHPLPVLRGGWLVYALVYAGFAMAGTAWHAWALFLVYGLFFGLTESPEKALVALIARPELRARAYGIFHFTVGVAVLPASLIFGLLWEVWGAPAAFFLGAALALAATLLLPLMVPRRTVREAP